MDKGEKNERADGIGAGQSPLTSRRGMGGRFGAEGFAYQTRYIVARLPSLLADPSFEMLLHEGAEDVDIRFTVEGKTHLEAVQVKGYQVGKKPLEEILKNFRVVDEGTHGAYQRFVVACKSLHSRLQQLHQMLVRFRGANPLYYGGLEAIDLTVQDLKKSIKELGLAEYEKLIIEKLYFEPDVISQDEAVGNSFTVGLQKLPTYATRR